MKRRDLLLSSVAAAGVPAFARAQAAYPSQTIRLIHGYDAGSNPDTIARYLAPGMSEILGVQIVIEPKPGAAERLAATQVARMKPDGYALYLMTGGQAVVSGTDPAPPYDLLRDFDFIAIVTRFPFVFAVTPESRFRTMEAFLDEARRQPDKLTYGTSGVGSTLHMAMELLLSQIGVRMTHVPYKGALSAPYNDLVGGRLDLQISTFSNAQPLMRSGRLRVLAVTSKERLAGFPDVPSLAEKILPGYDVASWLGFTAPVGLPPAVMARLHEAIVQVMARPEVRDKLQELGNDTRVTTPAEFRARVEADLARWRPLARVVQQG